MKKICFFTNSIKGGGVESVFNTYCNELCEDYEVSYIYCVPTEKDIKKFKPAVHLVCLQVNRFRKSLPKLIKALNKENPDYLITGGDLPNLYCIIARFLSKSHTKLIISQHNYLNVEYNAILHRLCFKFYNYADKILAVSSGICNFLLQHGINEKKIETLYNPVDIAKINKLSKDSTSIDLPDNYIVFLGRLSPVKNLSYLLDAFELIYKKYNLKLLFVGDGSERHTLEKETLEKGLEEDVIFVGSQQNPFPYLANAKAMLLPSYSEALPTVVIEAFVLGITVVATPTNGATDLLAGGKYGYLTKGFEDPKDLALKIEEALKNPHDKEELKNFANNFAASIKKDEFENILQSLS